MAIPTIINNILSIEEGNTRTLSLNNLNATAEGATTADILITIVPDSDTSLAGQFLLNDAPTLSFTLAQVETGQVEFAHDNSNFTPSYSVIASNNGDQSDAQQALVFFDAVNDAPTIDTKELTITEGGTVVFNLDMVNLLATDEPGESTPAELTYGITKVTNGTFQRLVDGGTVDLGVSDAAFTQADIDNNLIQFVHDGSEQAPTIELRIVDSGLPMSDDDPPGRLIDLAPIGQTFDVDIEFFPINDAPKITVNEISLFEGDIVPITVENLAATDVEEDDATLTFTITAIAQGRFELLDAPEGNVVQVLAAPGQESVGFTQAQVTAGLIQFVNDPATETEPSYTVVVKDSGQLTATDDPNPDLVEASEPSEAKVDYTTVNDTPIVVLPDSENPTLIDLMEQSQVTLTAADLFVKDEESDASNLTYTVKDLDDTPAGQFVRLDSGGGAPTPVTTFTQADIDAEAIAFDYFGVTEAPSFLLTVTDEGGKEVEIDSSEIFNFLPENAAPERENLALIVDEGAIVPITADNLLYTDEESAASDLTYTVTINNIDPDNPQDTDDRFIINGAVEVGATVTFTQQQINDGEVVFVHGGSNDAPDLTVTLTDTAVGGDANTIDVPLNDFIAFNDENDPPLLETFAFTLSEGDTVELTSDVLSVKDEEAAAAEITYTVKAVSGGDFFRLPTDPGGDPTLAETFTQAEIDAGDVLIFKHDGLNDGPTFTLTVSDGTNEIEVTDQSGQGVNYTPINDDPTVAVSSFTVPEGDPNNPVPITLTAENLLVEDEESAPEDLTYTITITNNDEDNPDRFQIDGVIEVGETVTFTQADVNAGLVKFIHGGSNSIATLTATVKDTFPEEFGEPITIDVPLTVGFDALNDAPIVENNIILEINEGGIEPLGADNLLTTDEETAAEDLVYTITGVNNGTFERVDLDQGTSTTILVGETFTQAEINAGEIRFVHDGGEDAPTYELSVVDTPLEMGGEVTSVPIASNIIKFNNLNDDPTLDVNQLIIKEGEEKIFDAENIAASDPDHDQSELRFNITNVKGGTFTFQGEALVEGKNFTVADLAFGDLIFQDDGDETPPSYDVTVLDPLGGNATTAADVIFDEVNDFPMLEENIFTIKEGERLALNAEIVNLQASDFETPADELIFIFTDINGGAFFDANAQEIPAGTEITQALLNTGTISFLQDGSSPEPSFNIIVKDTDGGELTPPIAANVDFIPVNDEPTVTSNPFAVTEGNPFTLTTAELLTVDDPGESGPAELTYTVILTNNDEDQPDGFRIGDGELQTESVTFTQEDVNEGRVTFVHGGSNTIATLTATVTDTFPEEFGEPFELPVELTATLNATNDSLVVVNKSVSINEGEPLILSSDDLLTTDEETPPEGLTYTVVATTNGSFQRLDDQGTGTDIAIDGTFTQAEVNAGDIQFLHNGSEEAPTFSLKVEDEPLTPDDEATSETFDGIIEKFNNLNDAPTFDFNTLTVTEGAEVALTAENLSASDVDNLPSDLRFSITAVNGGEFFLKGEALALNETFTAAAIAFEELTFKDDGDEEAATYTVKVEDGAGGETEESITVILDKVNDDPVIETNTFTITEGERLELNTDTVNLAATDQETPADELRFFVSNVEGVASSISTPIPLGKMIPLPRMTSITVSLALFMMVLKPSRPLTLRLKMPMAAKPQLRVMSSNSTRSTTGPRWMPFNSLSLRTQRLS
ncbi:MAG: hypothetical protein F6K00_09885 [Leptolyngbya sp. SIOISBB]|nr:hypothetical protein [Leptolyngbya sp. SIOISBB]